MTRVKICGITNLEDALYAAECGADALGFVLYEKSPRYIRNNKVYEIVKKLPPFVKTVGLFVNAGLDYVLDAVDYCHLNLVQLHGDEDLEFCKEVKKKTGVIKAIRVKGSESIKEIQQFSSVIRTFLLDAYIEGTYGGTGASFDWELVHQAKEFGDIVIAGGLNRENILEVVKNIKPYGVDVSSGVEISPGKKDKEKVKDFIRIAKGIDQ